jgi:hypothetical protein
MIQVDAGGNGIPSLYSNWRGAESFLMDLLKRVHAFTAIMLPTSHALKENELASTSKMKDINKLITPTIDRRMFKIIDGMVKYSN